MKVLQTPVGSCCFSCCPCLNQAAVLTRALLYLQTNLLAYMEARLLGNNANSNMFINCLELAELLVGANELHTTVTHHDHQQQQLQVPVLGFMTPSWLLHSLQAACPGHQVLLFISMASI